MSDVLAAMERWFNSTNSLQDADVLLCRARDEIVALRTERDEYRLGWTAEKHNRQQARAEAMEEAARVCECFDDPPPGEICHPATAYRCAAAIRALKEKTP